MKQMSLEEQMEEIFSYYGEQKDRHTQEMVVALLRELQEVQGHITPALKKRVLETTGVAEGFLKTILRLHPSIKQSANLHEILACTGERCGNKGGMEILRRLRKELGISKDGMSEDGMFRLRTQNCLKKCKTSPNLMIDGVVYSGKELENLKKLLQRVREGIFE